MGGSLYLLCQENISCTDTKSATHIENSLFMLAVHKTNYLEESIKLCLEINVSGNSAKVHMYICAKRNECRDFAGLE
jgi:hypothetical protein